jgi:hypothetical protein
MTAFVSPERARTASLTGGIGFLMIAIAVVMMVIAAPMVRHGAQNPAHNPAHNPPKPSAVQLMMDPCHRLTSRNGQTKVHACLAGPWAKEYASAL